MENDPYFGEQFDLLPYEMLPNATHPSWDCDPFSMVRLGDQGQILYFIAVNHRSLPDQYTNPHYAMVFKGIGIFELLTWDKERCVVVEGAERIPQDTWEASYWAGGEGGLGACAAEMFGYKQRCFEPPDHGVQYLRSQGFTEEVIATFLFSRLVPSWHRRLERDEHITSKPPTFEEFVQTRITGGGSLAPVLAQFDYTYVDYVRMFEEFYEMEFLLCLDMVHFLREETTGYMLSPRSRVHEAAIAVNKLRDHMLASGIKELWDSGISAIIPYGYTHGLTLKPFIEGLGIDLEEKLKGHSQALYRELAQMALSQCFSRDP